jgi:glycine oxidase
MESDSEFIVVGGGVAGLSVAIELLHRGHALTVVDPDPGRGASYVAAGMLAPASEVNYSEDLMGKLLIEAAQYWDNFVEVLESYTSLDCGYERRATLLTATEHGDFDELMRLQSFHRELGIESHLMGRSEVLDLEPTLSPKVIGGLYTPKDYQVDNRVVLSRMIEIVEDHARIVRARVKRVVRTAQGRYQLRLDNPDVVEGERVVLCNPMISPEEVLNGLLDEDLARAVATRPVRGEIIRLRDTQKIGPSVCVRSIRHGRWNYIVPRTSGEVVVGATQEEVPLMNNSLPKAGGVFDLLYDAIYSVPSLREMEIVELSSGYRPGTYDNYPNVGELLPNLYIHSGHYRHGFLLAPYTASLLVQAIGRRSNANFSVELQRFTEILDPYRRLQDGR